ncbi:N/A [soil metagenome]
MSTLSFWPLFTRLGEAQILLPLVALAALWLWLGAGQGALARRWLLAVGCAVALTTASKLAFIGWEVGVADWDFTGISGHAACSAAILPMLGWLLVCGRAKPVRRAGVLGGFALAGLIAWSRLAVDAHSSSEAISGFVLGSVASWIALSGLSLARAADNMPFASAAGSATAAPRWLQTAVIASLLVLPFSAPRSQSHDWVTALSVRLSGRGQPFMRHELHRQPQLMQQQRQPAALRSSQSSRVIW